MKKKNRYIQSSILLGIIFFIVVIFNSCNPPDEIYLLPDGYKGIVIILHEQKDGIDDKFENGKLVFEIPSKGVQKPKDL